MYGSYALKSVVGVLLCLGCAGNVFSEGDTSEIKQNDIPELSLNDCLMIGVEENLRLKNERINVRQAEIRSRIYKTSLVFPDIYANLRVSEVVRPHEKPTLSQSMRAYSNFKVFDMAQGPTKRKYQGDILLREYWVRTATADLQRDIAIAYIEANLVRKKQEILIAQLLELDSLMETGSAIGENREAGDQIFRLKDNILPLKEVIKTRLKALETNYEDKIGQLNNLMSLENSHTFRLADELILSDNGIENENDFVSKIIERATKLRTEDDDIRKKNLEEDMKRVNAGYFPTISAGVAYDEDFMTNFKGFTANVNLSYNVLDPNARKKKDIAKLDIEKINNTIVENIRDLERWIRSNYNKSKEYRGQVRISLIDSQKDLYSSTLALFFSDVNNGISPNDVINTFKDYYQAKTSYYENIAYSEIQKMYIRNLLMDYITPFEELGDADF